MSEVIHYPRTISFRKNVTITTLCGRLKNNLIMTVVKSDVSCKHCKYILGDTCNICKKAPPSKCFVSCEPCRTKRREARKRWEQKKKK